MYELNETNRLLQSILSELQSINGRLQYDTFKVKIQS